GDVVGELPAGARVEPQSPGHSSSVTSLAFDPTGRLLASGSGDTTARIWDVSTRRTRVILRGHSGPVHAVAFTPDGRRLLTAGKDGQVILWDIERGAILAQALPDPGRQGPGGATGNAINTHCLAVSPDGRRVIIGRENGDVVCYQTAGLRREWLR